MHHSSQGMYKKNILSKSLNIEVLKTSSSILMILFLLVVGSRFVGYFEKAAETYLTALSTNKELNIVSDEVAEKTAQETADYPINLAQLHLEQIRLILDKEEPEYKN